jgi:hypothetical protein
LSIIIVVFNELLSLKQREDFSKIALRANNYTPSV